MTSLFRKLFLVELLQGMWMSIKVFVRPHITVEYPKETVVFTPRFRGVPRLRRAISDAPSSVTSIPRMAADRMTISASSSVG